MAVRCVRNGRSARVRSSVRVPEPSRGAASSAGRAARPSGQAGGAHCPPSVGEAAPRSRPAQGLCHLVSLDQWPSRRDLLPDRQADDPLVVDSCFGDMLGILADRPHTRARDMPPGSSSIDSTTSMRAAATSRSRAASTTARSDSFPSGMGHSSNGTGRRVKPDVNTTTVMFVGVLDGTNRHRTRLLVDECRHVATISWATHAARSRPPGQAR